MTHRKREMHKRAVAKHAGNGDYMKRRRKTARLTTQRTGSGA